MNNNRNISLAIVLDREDWSVICGWIESAERAIYVPTAAKELAELLRKHYFPIQEQK